MTIDWKTRKTWYGLIDHVLLRECGKDYSAVLRLNAETIRYSDCEDEGFDLFRSCAEPSKIVASIEAAVRSRVQRICAYHACRTENIHSYLNHGIRTLDPKAIQNECSTIFSLDGIDGGPETLQRVIEKLSLETREGVVYLGIDDRDLVDNCGHYLIYGSEYLQCLAINLPNGGWNNRDVLRSKGRATIIKCEVPLKWVPEHHVEQLVHRMIADHFYSLAHAQEEVSHQDFTIARHSLVRPDMIRSHYHPVHIPDPFQQRRVWDDERATYLGQV